MKAPLLRIAVLSLALLPGGAVPASGQLSRDEAACLRAMNAGLLRVARAQSKEGTRCVQQGAKGKLASSIEACLTADPKGKVGKVAQKTLSDEGRRCGAPASFGPDDAAAVNAAAIAAARDTLHDLFGPNADAAVLSKQADPAGARCQKALLKAASGCLSAKLADFNACKKAGARNGAITSSAELGACLGEDLRGHIAKACDDPARPDKIRRALDRKCLAKGADLAAALPPCGIAGDAEATFACLEPRIECRACQAVKLADALALDCDLFDDGLDNASCADAPPPPPGENDVHLPVVFVNASLARAGGARGSPRGTLPIGFQTYFQVQNLGATSTDVTITYTNADGSVAGSDVIATNSHSVGRLFPGSASALPDGFIGAARFSSSNQIAVAATAEIFTGGFRGAAYTGVAAIDASTTVVMPSVGCDPSGFTTTFWVQNIGASTATISVEYIAVEAGQDLVQATTIPPSGFATGADCSLLGGTSGTFFGSATLASDQPIVAAAIEQDAFSGSLLAYNGVSTSSTALFAPLVRADLGGFSSGISIQNVGPSATTVDVVYGTNQVVGGNPAAAAAHTIPAGDRVVVAPSVVGSFAGSTSMTQPSAQPMVGLVSEIDFLNPARQSTYAALDAGAVGPNQAMPIVFANSNGFTTSVTCQALAAGTEIVVRYAENTEEPGETPADDAAMLAMPGDSVTFTQDGGAWDAIGRYVGSATIEATDDVACVAQIVGPETFGDSFYAYLPVVLK
jgi:hypothetical protein